MDRHQPPHSVGHAHDDASSGLSTLEPRMLMSGSQPNTSDSWLNHVGHTHGGDCACSACSAGHIAADMLLYANNGNATQTDDTPTNTADNGSTWTSGNKKILYIRVDFSDAAGDPVSENRANQVLQQTADFYQDASYGQFNIVDWDVTSTLRLPQSKEWYGSQSNGHTLIQRDARQAAIDAGYDYSDYWTDAIAFSRINSGSFAGWAGRAYLSWRGTWLNGDFSFEVTAHELGHNLGVGHANFYDASGSDATGSGREYEYGDPFNIMGLRGNGDFHAPIKQTLGWLTDNQFKTIDTSGTYRLYAQDDDINNSALTYGLNLGDNGDYVLEYQADVSQWNQGIVLTGESGYRKSVLYDLTPGSLGSWTSDRRDAALNTGQTHYDRQLGASITALSAGQNSQSRWIDVRVVLDSDPVSEPPSTSTTITLTDNEWSSGPTSIASGTTSTYVYSAQETGKIKLLFSAAQDAATITATTATGKTYTAKALKDGSFKINALMLSGQSITINIANHTTRSDQTTLTAKYKHKLFQVADFNNDQQADQITKNRITKQRYIKIKSDGRTVAKTSVPDLEKRWKLSAATDLTNDGDADLLWHNRRKGLLQLTKIDNGQIVETQKLNLATEPRWRLINADDFNADGHTDLVWQSVKTGRVELWFLDQTNLAHRQVLAASSTSKLAHAADTNNDGKLELTWSDGQKTLAAVQPAHAEAHNPGSISHGTPVYQSPQTFHWQAHSHHELDDEDHLAMAA